MKKRLLISVSNNYVYDRRMQRIADELSKSFDITIFAVRKDENAIQKARYPYAVHYSSIPFKSGILFYLFLNLQLIMYLLRSRYDVVYSVDLDTLGACSLATFFKKNKLVFDAHEFFTEVPELYGKTLKKKIWQTIGQFGVKRADLCYTVNDSLATILGEKYNNQFYVLRNMPYQIMSSSVHHSSNVILYQGAVNKGRGLESAIESMKDLPNYKLVIVGEGDLYSSLKKYVNEAALTNVEFTGYITPEKLADYTGRAWIGLNLIERYSLNYYYSLANKFFDYVQSGIPSINMNYPVYASLNKDFEVSVLLDDLAAESIVQAVRKLEDPSYYSFLQSECKKASEVWIWEKERQILEKVVQLVD